MRCELSDKAPCQNGLDFVERLWVGHKSEPEAEPPEAFWNDVIVKE